MIVLNLEPYQYSPKASAIISECAEYIAGSHDMISSFPRKEEVSAVIVRLNAKINSTIFDHFPKLRAVVSATTGLDHIDLAEAKKRNISILSLRGEEEFLDSIPSTAEHTFALLLALMRNIPSAFEDVRNGKWERDRFRGNQIKNKRFGIIGLGRIGRKVAEYALAFGAQVNYYDPYVDKKSAVLRKFDNLEEMLSESDVVSVHVHLKEDTVNLLAAKELMRIPKGGLVLNTSRSTIVNEEDLVHCLQSGHLKGAAVDVVAGEPDMEKVKQGVLYRYASDNANLIITPHIGGATYEAMEDCEIFMAHKTCKFLTT